MDWKIWSFLAGSIVVTIGLAAIGFSWAAMPAGATGPKPAEQMGSVEVGDGFGEVMVVELMDYWLTNPPVVSQAATAPVPERRFGGC